MDNEVVGLQLRTVLYIYILYIYLAAETLGREIFRVDEMAPDDSRLEYRESYIDANRTRFVITTARAPITLTMQNGRLAGHESNLGYICVENVIEA